MNPGLELDYLVAQKVFGWTHDGCNVDDHQNCWAWTHDGIDMYRGKDIQNYSTAIASAWEVVEKIPMVVWSPNAFANGGEYQNFGSRWRAEGSFLSKPGFYEAYGLTAPHAICLAALKAVTTEDKTWGK